MKYLIIYIIAINIIAFLITWLDKVLARKHMSRVSEKTLFILALVLGSIGVWSAMYVFRHKTKHTQFVIGIPVMFVLNCISVYYIIMYDLIRFLNLT